MVERKVKKRTRKTSPKRTRKTSPKRTRKTSPKRTRRTSPRRKIRSKRLNPSPFRRYYNRLRNYLDPDGDRQTGSRFQGASAMTESYIAEINAEDQRRSVLERAADALSHRYHSTFLYSHYSTEMANAITKTAQRLLLERFHQEMVQKIRIQNRTAIRGLTLEESRTVRSMALQMVLNMISEQYRL